MVYQDIKPLFRGDILYFINPKVGIVAMMRMVYHYNLGTYKHISMDLLTDFKLK
jgi:hypothetical protein